jgi:hypothetical protein
MRLELSCIFRCEAACTPVQRPSECKAGFDCSSNRYVTSADADYFAGSAAHDASAARLYVLANLRDDKRVLQGPNGEAWVNNALLLQYPESTRRGLEAEVEGPNVKGFRVLFVAGCCTCRSNSLHENSEACESCACGEDARGGEYRRYHAPQQPWPAAASPTLAARKKRQ